MVSGFTLRPLEPPDEAMVLAWANDPDTRQASLRSAVIDTETHAAWFATRLADPEGRVWIGLLGGRPIGQVRVERTSEGEGEVGIVVAPEARGTGLARPLLQAGMEAARAELGVRRFVALIRPDNARSLALFRGAGFEDAGVTIRADVACLVLRTPELPPADPEG